MRNETRQAFNQYTAHLATLNGVASAVEQFTVAPSIQQTLETKIQESSDFLGKINIIGVRELQGDKLGLGISGPVASRTPTATKDRTTRDLSTIDSKGYKCEKTDFDTHVPYAKLDAWAKFPNFQTLLRDLIIKRQALDRIMIGWNGTSVAAETNIAANPLLQDVNKGWLFNLQNDAPDQVLLSGDKTAGKVMIGADGDYKNLDALVFDLIQMLDPWHQNDSGLVCLLGRGLLHDKYFPLVNITQAPSETLAADIVISQKRVGGLPGVTVPFFPAGTVLVTRYDNLSIYWQEQARRRQVVDNAKRDRIENYESSNDAYVIEDNGLAAAARNIEFAEEVA